MTEIEQITSATNALIKRLKRLDRKKGRLEENAFLAEGARLIREGIDRGWTPVTVAIAKDSRSRPYIAEILDLAQAQGARCVEVPERLLGSISKKDNPQTIIAAFQPKDFTLNDVELTPTDLVIALYEVRDPGNLGTIIRTADCIGARAVVLIGSCCDRYSVEAVRASMGSLFALSVIETEYDAFTGWAHAQSTPIIAASMNGDRATLETSETQPAIILMGNEQKGLPDEIEARCDQLVRLPMRPGADSLNLANATAVMAYESWRQKGYPGAE
jgi:TrmH family RNA methyltransferase